jgi:hypothetical protein
MKFHVGDLARAREDGFSSGIPGPGYIKPGTITPVVLALPLDDMPHFRGDLTSECHPIRVSFQAYPEDRYHCACQFDHVERPKALEESVETRQPAEVTQ